MTAASGKAEAGAELLDRDLYEIARFVGIPASKITAFVGAAGLAGYHVTRTPAANGPGEAVIGAHPEDFCQKCGRENITWFTPNELWNKYSGDGESGILCPCCFVKAVSEIQSAWKLVPEFYDAQSTPQPGMVTVPRAFIGWLLGENAHPVTGLDFQQSEGGGRYWWRKDIRAMLDAAPSDNVKGK